MATHHEAGATQTAARCAPDLRAFLDGNCPDRRAAFDRLAIHARRFLAAYLRGKSPSTASLHEDVVQESLLRVWSARDRIENRGLGSWYCLLKRVADRCHVDMLRSLAHETDAPDEAPDDVPDGDEPLVDALARALDDADAAARIRHEADSLWLGLADSVSEADRERRCLAAQLLLVDRLPWRDVVRLLGQPVAGRAELDSWAREPAVIRLLAYHRLHLDGIALARRVECAASRSSALSDAERTVIAWRLGSGMSLEQIARRSDCPLTGPQLEALDDRLRAALPFASWMRELVEALQAARISVAEAALSSLGLWQRLAFEYRYADDLAHRDIHDRTAPAAGVVGREVTMGMLNVWLSNGRLAQRLAGRLAKRNGDHGDERHA
ncbi:MAG TPA: hypothetical protein VLH79_12000 [Chthonomonadales bacterium]|nr:hypothetical protein [Chthonomonadales bacterium]